MGEAGFASKTLSNFTCSDPFPIRAHRPTLPYKVSNPASQISEKFVTLKPCPDRRPDPPSKTGSVAWSQLRHTVHLSRQGKHAEALARVDQLLKLNHVDPRFYFQIALVQLEAGQCDRAWQTLEEADSLAEDSPVLTLYRALILGEMERWDEGLVEAERLRRLCPQHQFTASLLCYLYLGYGEIQKALDCLEIGKPPGWVSWFRPELAAFGPLLSRLLLQVELYLLPLEFPVLSAQEARTDPELVDTPPQRLSLKAVLDSLAGLYYQRKGIHYWEKGLNLSASDPRKGHFYLEKALECQRLAVQREPLQFRGFYHLGEALLYSATHPDRLVPDAARLEEAEKCFVHSWKQEGPNPYLYFYLGRTVQLQGQPAAARIYLERALEKFAKFPEAHYALGQIHLLMGQPAEAREWLKKSVSSDFLPVARERLQELALAVSQGKLHQRLPMPLWPPVAPTADSGPKVENPPPAETPVPASEGNEQLHQCADPESPPENRETCPAPADPGFSEHPSSSSAPELATVDPAD